MDTDGSLAAKQASPSFAEGRGAQIGCYVARLAGFGGTLDEIISNDLATEGGLVITVAASDAGFETNGCGTWTKVS